MFSWLFNKNSFDAFEQQPSASSAAQESIRREHLIAEYFEDAAPSLLAVLSNEQLSTLSAVVEYRCSIKEALELPDENDIKVITRITQYASQFLEEELRLIIDHQSPESSLKLLEIDRVLDLSIREVREQTYETNDDDLKEALNIYILRLEAVKDKIRDLPDKIVDLPTFIGSVCIAPQESLARIHWFMVARYVESYFDSTRSIVEKQEGARALCAFIEGVGHLDIAAKKDSDENLLYEVLKALCSRNNHQISSDPDLRPIFLPLFAMARQDYLTAGSDNQNDYRAGVVETVFRDEIDALRQHNLRRNPSNTLSMLSYGWGSDYGNSETAKAIRDAIRDQISHNQDIKAQIGVPKKSGSLKLIEELVTDKYHSQTTNNLPLKTQIQRIERIIARHEHLNRLVREAFLEDLRGDELRSLVRIAAHFNREEGVPLWSLSESMLRTALVHPNIEAWTKACQNATEIFSPPIAEHLQRISGGNAAGLRAFVDEMKVTKSWSGMAVSDEEIMAAATLEELSEKLRAEYFGGIVPQLKMAERMPVLSNDHLVSAHSLSLQNIEEATKDSFLRGLGMKGQYLRSLVRDPKFIENLCGVYDLSMSIVPTEPIDIDLNSRKQILLQQFPRGLLPLAHDIALDLSTLSAQKLSLRSDLLQASAPYLFGADAPRGVRAIELAIVHSIKSREAFFDLLASPQFDEEVLQQLFRKYEIETPSFQIWICEKSHRYSWNRPFKENTTLAQDKAVLAITKNGSLYKRAELSVSGGGSDLIIDQCDFSEGNAAQREYAAHKVFSFLSDYIKGTARYCTYRERPKFARALIDERPYQLSVRFYGSVVEGSGAQERKKWIISLSDSALG